MENTVYPSTYRQILGVCRLDVWDLTSLNWIQRYFSSYYWRRTAEELPISLLAENSAENAPDSFVFLPLYMLSDMCGGHHILQGHNVTWYDKHFRWVAVKWTGNYWIFFKINFVIFRHFFPDWRNYFFFCEIASLSFIIIFFWIEKTVELGKAQIKSLMEKKACIISPQAKLKHFSINKPQSSN